MNIQGSPSPTMYQRPKPVTPPRPARIARIKLDDYRAFPPGDTLILDLSAEGKNLLLYGENGSGKTSFARALRELTAFRKPPVSLEAQRHVFRPPADSPQSLLAVEFNGGPINEFRWSAGDPHPSSTAGQPYQSFARGCLSLDYRDLLETNYLHDGTPNLFNCLIESILTSLPVLNAGKRQPLGDLHKAISESLSRIYATNEDRVAKIKGACTTFSTALKNHVPEVVAAAQKIFSKLGHVGTDFTLDPHLFDYDADTDQFTPGRIDFSVTHHGHSLSTPQHFLNEARLTALALALYLGAAQVAMPPPLLAPGAQAFTRTLILDDVLIGLDLSNRLPLLRVLAEDFADWQVILLTHDRVWFELAREHTEHSGAWIAKELCLLEGPEGVPARPVFKDAGNLLVRAKGHLASTPPDLMAAAVYLRAAFETRLKNICESHGIAIPYKLHPKDVKADTLWQGILERQKHREKEQAASPSKGIPDFIPATLVADVETMRSTILNRLSHSGTPTFVKSEVDFALKTVTALQNHVFPKA